MGKLPIKLKSSIDYLKTYKNLKLHIVKDIHNATRYKLQEIDINKKEQFF